MNKRDHRKMVIIDGTYAFIGSINFAKSHFSNYSTKPWFDLAAQIRGNLITMLERAFLGEFNRKKPSTFNFWNDLSLPFKNHPQWFPINHKIRLNHNFVLRFLYWRDLLKRIRRAKSRVYIMNAYFVPHQTLLRSLKVAARKGVEVVILLPSTTDVPVVKWFAPIFYRKLIRDGVLIREIQDQMIHTKSVIIDDWALIGSNNLNYRSLIHDLEVEVVVDTKPMLEKLLTVWQSKITQSNLIDLNSVQKLTWIAWIRFRVVLLIRYFV
jgi:cardiolipin synthase